MRLQVAVGVVMVVVVMVVVEAEPPPPPPPPQSPPPPQDATTPTTTSFLMGKPCPAVELTPDFNSTAFGGRWYKFGGSPNMQEITSKCTEYAYDYTGSGFWVTEKGVNEKGERVNQRSILSQPTKGVGEFTTAVEGLQARLQVLSTDYSSMACLYTCYTFRGTHRVHFAWILSRTPTLSREKIASCQILLRGVDILVKNLERTDHAGLECI